MKIFLKSGYIWREGRTCILHPIQKGIKHLSRKNTEMREESGLSIEKLFPSNAISCNKKVDLGPSFKYLKGFQTCALLCLLCPLPKPASPWPVIH